MELDAISSNPNSFFRFFVNNFTSLNNILTTVINNTCEGNVSYMYLYSLFINPLQKPVVSLYSRKQIHFRLQTLRQSKTMNKQDVPIQDSSPKTRFSFDCKLTKFALMLMECMNHEMSSNIPKFQLGSLTYS